MYQEVEIYVPNRKVAVVGAGYIAVELAGILNALGSKVSTLIRYDKVFTYTTSLGDYSGPMKQTTIKALVFSSCVVVFLTRNNIFVFNNIVRHILL